VLGTGFHDQEIAGVRWRSFTLQVGDLRISTADSWAEREQLKHSIFLSAAVPVSVALIGSLVLLWIGIAHGLRPLRLITEALLRRNADSLEPLQPGKLPVELKPLVDSQNQLFERISQAIERERRFTGDAAHELRSPLTAIKTHLQVARMTTGDDSARALMCAEEGADRLHRTLEQLLLLARVEGTLSFEDGGPVSAREVAVHAIEDATHGTPLQIDARLEGIPEDAQLRTPPLLAVVALRNLMENAIRYSPAGERIALSVVSEPAHLCFVVQDKGPGVKKELLSNLTQRFWNHGTDSGSGLGLAIVKAIVQRFGGDLSFENLSVGLKVTLRLPRTA
jgi:signal transduction histidine kinase